MFYWADRKFVQIADEGLKHRNINSLVTDFAGQLWVGTDQGLRCYDTNGLLKGIAISDPIKSLLVDRHGILWVGTWGTGLARCQDGKFTFLRKVDGLADDYVTSLFEDAEGSLWVGTREGLSQLTDLKFPIYSIKEGMSEGSCHAVFASRNGGLWITTDRGVSYFDGQSATNYPAVFQLSNPYIKTGYEAHNGDVYLVGADKIINVLSGDHISARYTNQNWSVAFAEDAEGMLVSSGETLNRIQDGQLRPFQHQDGVTPTYYWLNHLCAGKDEAIWVASNNGIFCIRNGAFRQWAAAEGLVGLKVQWIFEDVDGSIWAGSEAGMARLKGEKLKTIGQANGLADDRILAIVPDDRGYFWISSGRGIFRATRQSLNDFADGKIAAVQCELFDGLESVKFNDQTDQEFSGCKTSDGRIWFPNPQGVVMIDPGHFFTNPIAPPVHLEQIKIDGTEVKGRDDLIFHRGINRAEFFFSALSYIAPRKTQIRYRLAGFDPDWIDAGANRSVLYTKLPPGKYNFRVQAVNADGVWNFTGSSFGFEIPPAFYQTFWFDGLCVLAGVLILFGTYR